MIAWLTQYAGYLLIAAGALLFTSLIPSAAGPADIAAVQPQVTAPVSAASGQSTTTPRLIAGPRGGATSPGAATLPTPIATAEPASPASATSLPSGRDAANATSASVVTPPEATALPSLPFIPSTDRVVIPRIGLDTKVVEVGVLPSGEMATAAFAAGRLNFSAQAGDAGNSVIAGHNDIDGEVFRRLPELRVGDELTLFRGEQPFRYRVQIRTIVREDGATEAQRRENARWMDPTDVAAATLISCYPYRVDTHRLIIRALLVE